MRLTYKTARWDRDGMEPPPTGSACLHRARLPLKFLEISSFSVLEPPALVEKIDYVSSGIKSLILKTLEFSPAVVLTD